MTVWKVIVEWGQSNQEGLAPIADVTSADYTRWTGALAKPSFTVFPVIQTAPGLKYWHNKLPYGSGNIRTATGYTSTTASDSTASFTTNAFADRWIYIRTAAGGGQGQLRRIASNTATQITVTSAWTTTPVGASTFDVWMDSDTVGSATTTTITKGGTTPNWTANEHSGRWVNIISGSGALQSVRITSNTTTVLTLEDALLLAPSAGDGFRILTAGGINSYAEVASLGATAGKVDNFRFYIDPNAQSRSDPYETSSMRQTPNGSPVLDNFFGIGPDIELSWLFNQAHDSDVITVKMAVSQAYTTRFNGTLTFGYDHGWFAKDQTNDWHPASGDGDLFDLLKDNLNNLLLWLRTNEGASDTIDVIGVFGVGLEAESYTTERANISGAALRLFRDKLRAHLVSAGMTTKQDGKIPFVNSKVRNSALSPWPYGGTVNAQMAVLEKEDQYFGLVETDDLAVEADNIHYTAASQVTLAGRLFAKWSEIVEAEAASTTQAADRDTLTELISATRKRLERNSVSPDHPDALITDFLNDAQIEVYRTLGDKAWFLRRMETASDLAIGGTATTTLPYYMRRFLRIESSSCPGRMLDAKLVGYTDNGRLQLIVHDYVPGPHIIHYMAAPSKLVNGTDMTLLPKEYVELLVVLACKRLTESSGNQTILAYYEAEAERLFKYVKRDCDRFDRQRQETLYGQGLGDSWGAGASGFLGPIPW